ncbi:BnaA06g10300D [Brassica napus]|uniref:BnaA06g10300D protein n=1 Tax=Brassica napus TaxID=3708 RepID=A0A078HFK1_BRANA|nr:BnaA06g10300D [Brassica napus]
MLIFGLQDKLGIFHFSGYVGLFLLLVEFVLCSDVFLLANHVGFARAGSNPAVHVFFKFLLFLFNF